MFEAPYEGLVKLDENYMKSKEGKEKWRNFINACVFFSTRCFDSVYTKVADTTAKSRTLTLVL